MSDQIDQRGVPTHECFNCGSNMFKATVTFKDYEIAVYWDEGTCAMCDSAVTLPTLPDHPYWNKETRQVDNDLPNI